MKEIQEWLGHSDFGTTANFYAHLDANSKISSANVMRKTGMHLRFREQFREQDDFEKNKYRPGL